MFRGITISKDACNFELPETSLIRFNEKILGCMLSDTKLPTIVSSNKKRINSF